MTHEQRAKLDNYGKAFLALALYRTNGDQIDARVETLLQELDEAAQVYSRSVYWKDRVQDYYGMSTSARTTAIVIEALTRLNLDNPKLDPAVRWLLAQRHDGHWQTTQETSMSLSALTEYLTTTFEREGRYVDSRVRTVSCPPEAAFAAADLEGIMIQAEGPQANVPAGSDPARDAFIEAEFKRIVDTYGNHPSFCTMALGNEYGGKDELLSNWVGMLIGRDSRHLYTQESTLRLTSTG